MNVLYFMLYIMGIAYWLFFGLLLLTNLCCCCCCMRKVDDNMGSMSGIAGQPYGEVVVYQQVSANNSGQIYD